MKKPQCSISGCEDKAHKGYNTYGEKKKIRLCKKHYDKWIVNIEPLEKYISRINQERVKEQTKLE